MIHTIKTPDPSPLDPSRLSGRTSARTITRSLQMACILLVPLLIASDHADPIDLFNKERLEGGITDLFVFPVTADGKVAFPHHPSDEMLSLSNPYVGPRQKLSDEERSQIKGIVMILCVRRALTQRGSLLLEPYTYRIHMDQYTPITFADPSDNTRGARPVGPGGSYQPPAGQRREMTVQEARARYGGSIANPEGINADVTIELRLRNDATLNGDPTFTGLRNINGWKPFQESREELPVEDKVVIHTGIHDDPFIFPAFFRTNVVAMVLHVPITAFDAGKTDWLIWATSHKNGRQVDHVGRSLRTQNPRFEILNTLHPKDHVAAIMKADRNPSLKRDAGLRLNLQGIAAYRSWDFVPDVMIYSRQFQVGFPNGRTIADDVAMSLALHGDTALLELSHQHPNGGWPRRTTNDMPFHHTTEEEPFQADFPYLADPWPDRDAAPAPMLTVANRAKLVGFIAAAAALLIAVGFLFGRWYYNKKLRPRYI